MKLNLHTMRSRLIILFFLVALLPMGLLAFVNNRTTRQALIDDANQALYAVSLQTAASLDNFIADNLSAVKNQAQLPTLIEYLSQHPNGLPDSPEEIEVIRLLNALSERDEYITSIAVLNNDGVVLADTVVDEVWMDKSDRSYFDYFQNPHNSETFVSPVEFSQTTGQASLYFSAAVHAEDGSILGFLRMRYNAHVLQILMEAKNGLAGPGSFGVLFDEYHNHLAHGTEPNANFVPIIHYDTETDALLRAAHRLPDIPDEELYSLQLDELEANLSKMHDDPFFEAEDVATGNRVNQVAIVQLQTQPWIITFFQPQEIFLAPVTAQSQNTAILVAVFAVLAIVLAFIIGGLIGRPIVNLTENVTSFTSGDRTARSGIQSSDEIGVLATSFNEMADRVQTLIGDLELRADDLRRSEQRYRSISDLTSDYIYSSTVTKDNQLVLDWSTEAFSRLTGYTPEELAELGGWSSLIHEDDRQRFNRERSKLLVTGGQDYSEYRIVTKDGQVRWLRDFRRATVDAKSSRVVNLLGAAQDITIHKLRDQELESAKEMAEDASRAKSSFLANMSHELRTPLNAILGFSQLMSGGANLNEQQNDYLGIINRSGEHLLTLINDVLEISKIEAGRTKLQPNHFDLHKLLQELESMLSLRTKEKGLHMLFEHIGDIPQFIRADESKIRQVLINLINNAIKFTHEGGIALRIRCDKDQQQQLHFEVEDSGDGIAPHELDGLFEAFVQTSSGEISKEGTGLGLAISKEFIELMDGQIIVTSQIGRGSIFKFHIEVELSDASEVQPSATPRQAIGLEPGQPSYRILIVDDREINRRLLVELLTPLGFEIREAVNGKEAVEIWQNWLPQLIWMDMRMPVMDGYEATSMIRSLPNGNEPVIIALTASAFEENRVMSLEAGAYDFVRKPFRNEEIFEKIAKHLDVRFIYEEESAAEPQAPASEHLSAADLAGLPSELVNALHQAAMQADSELVMQVVIEISSHNAQLANTLAHLVDNFRFDLLLAASQAEGA